MKRILFRIVLLFAASCVTPLDGAAPVLGQAARRESTSDDENLESLLREELLADHDVDVATEDRSVWREAARFKKDTSVSDERFHAALMKIYREAETTAQAKNQESQDMQVLKDAERWMRSAVFWLGVCEDVASKTFLLDLASDTSKGGALRVTAILSYLHVADAEETMNILLRFLVGEDRMGEHARSSIYRYPETVWDTASPEKKAAMFSALFEAAAVESVQWAFDECDSQLIAMCPAYRDSLQRKGMLKRQLSVPFPKYYSELKEKMEKEVERLEKLRKHTSINTNPVTAIARDFNQPLPEEERIALETPPNAPHAGGTAQEEPQQTGSKGFYALAAVAGLLGVLVLWFGLRRKRGPA
jgi:hypothetical protein